MNLKYALIAAALLPLAPLKLTAQDAPSYGPAITLETARKVAAGAEAEARKNNWRMAIAIVDNHGTLVYYQMTDDTQYGSAFISVEKAKTAALSLFVGRRRHLKTTLPLGAARFSAYPV